MIDFYRGKRVFITGHTGFKGTWLTKYLIMAGAEVTGYALGPEGNVSLFELSNVSKEIHSHFNDIRDFESLKMAFDKAKPEIVFHLAAQPIVKTSYELPVYTYDVNVMGTVNLMECVRLSSSVKSVINITTDKVYENKEWQRGYCENDVLGGHDPYANSKSCSEMVTKSYKDSFLNEKSVAVSTARAGNVIGGGDFSELRIIPDCYRAIIADDVLVIRNPESIRPYQYVLDSINAYLQIAMAQYHTFNLSDCYNIGPEDKDIIKTKEIIKLFEISWGKKIKLEILNGVNFHETSILKLDSSKIRNRLGWQPTYDIFKAIEDTVYFYKKMNEGSNIEKLLEKLIIKYFDFEISL